MSDESVPLLRQLRMKMERSFLERCDGSRKQQATYIPSHRTAKEAGCRQSVDKGREGEKCVDVSSVK